MRMLEVQLSDAVANRLGVAAKRRKIRRDALARRAIEQYLGLDEPHPLKTCGEVMADLIGRFHGPADLSTNPEYLRGVGA